MPQIIPDKKCQEESNVKGSGQEWRAVLGRVVREDLSEEVTFLLRPQ